MKYLSICSGIEAASVAWHDLDWQAVGFSEIDAFPSAVLSHRFPSVPNFGDMTRHADWNIAPAAVDLVVGGTPCQSFSVAGLRAGMADPRGNLALTFLAIVDRLRPEWVVWENVPGVLSSNHGRDFGAFLGALAELGFGFAYRVLDAQHFGVAQRRRRVFVVANATDWRRAAAVLFEPESLRRHPAPGEDAGQGAAAGTSSGVAGRYLGNAEGGAVEVPFLTVSNLTHLNNQTPLVEVGSTADVSATVTSKWAKGSGGPAGSECGNLVLQPEVVFTPSSFANYREGVGTLKANGADIGGGSENLVLQPAAVGADLYNQTLTGDVAASVTTARGVSNASVLQTTAVRRLTPVECERLQGFPDDWTAIPYRGKPAADGPRYKAIGNSMAVPVMRWLGERIAAVDAAIGGAR